LFPYGVALWRSHLQFPRQPFVLVSLGSLERGCLF
jgi:hypothetical protein